MQRHNQATKFYSRLTSCEIAKVEQQPFKLRSQILEHIQFVEAIQAKHLIAKKILQQEEQLVVEKASRIKKSKRSKKKHQNKSVHEGKENIITVVSQLLDKYAGNIARNSVVWAKSLREKTCQKEIFLTILKSLEAEYQHFQIQFQAFVTEHRQTIDFGHFLDFENPLPNQFCAMIYRTFPELKKYIEQFDRKQLTAEEIRGLKYMEGGIIPLFMDYDYEQIILDEIGEMEDQIEIDFSLLDKDDDDSGDTATTVQQKKKKKNRRKKNKKKALQENGNPQEHGEQEGEELQCQIDKIIQCESRIDDDTHFEQLMNLIQNLEIHDEDRSACNVTEQWLQSRYLALWQH